MRGSRRVGERAGDRRASARWPLATAARLACAAALLAAGCSEDGGPLEPVPEGPIALDVRVHLLALPDDPELGATLTDEETALLIDRVSEIWSQAEISWRLESIVRADALEAERLARALRGDGLLVPALVDAVPPEGLTAGGWDVVLLRTLGGNIVGAYLQEIPAVLAAEEIPPLGRDLTGATARVVAHELGHTLGLIHVPCTEAGNLMAQGCEAEDRTRLEPFQIEIARRQAARGRPF